MRSASHFNGMSGVDSRRVQPSRRRRWIGASAVLVGTMVLASACSSSTPSSTSSSGPSTDPASSAAQNQAASIVAKYAARPTSIGISTPITKTIPKNKTVAFIECSLPSCTVLGGYVASAAQALGWKVDQINAGLTPETVKAAYDQAISSHADAVIGTGFDRSIFEPELATLKADNIPVIELSTADNAGNGITASYESTAANQAYGVLQAEWVYAELGTSANTLVIGVPTFQTISILVGAFTAKYKQLCSSCAIGQVNVSAEDIGTPTVASTVIGYLQSHPGVNVIETSDSDTVIGLPSALAAAGLHPKIVVLDASPTVASYIQKGTVAVSTAAPWNTLMWLSIDTLARIFAGQSTAPDTNWVHPQWFVTSKNVPSVTNYYGSVSPSANDAAFEKLWGVN
jgi:ribose transport system substrate-binding protein